MIEAAKTAVQADIPLAPVAVIVRSGVATGANGQRFAVLQVSTPMGPLTFMLNAEQAESAADQLKLAAAQVRTGLTIAGT
jgi:hypothetical protein